jgi:hypothetical protein
MKRRWSPKDWPAPKSRRTRFGWFDEDGNQRPIDLNRVLRDHYPANAGRPWWAKLARAHGWMSEDDYFDVPEEPGESPFVKAIYAPSPFLEMLRKAWNG